MTAANYDLYITQGDTVSMSRSFQYIVDGNPADLSAATGKCQIRTKPFDIAGSKLIYEYVVNFSTLIHAAQPVTQAFNGDFVVSGFSNYVDAFGKVLVKYKGAYPGDNVTITGSTSNDGVYEVLEVIDANTLRIDQTLNSEPAFGSVQVDRIGNISLESPTILEAEQFTFKQAVWDLKITIGSERFTFLKGSVFNSLEVTR